MAPKDPERVTDSDSPSETLSVQRGGGTFQRGPNLNLGFIFLLLSWDFQCVWWTVAPPLTECLERKRIFKHAWHIMGTGVLFLTELMASPLDSPMAGLRV